MPSLATLPIELITTIIGFSNDVSSLHGLAASCRLIHSLAHSRLYEVGRDAALAWAINNGKLDTLQYALNAGTAGLGIETLNRAAQHGHVDIVAELLSHETLRYDLLNFPSIRRAFSPVYLACAAGHCPVVELFLSLDGIEVDRPSGPNGAAPLYAAVSNNRADILSLLLDFGADPNLFRSTQQTPLQVAASSGYVDVAKILLGAGAEPNMIGSRPSVPLIEALKIEHLELVELLLDNGASPSERDPSFGTSLHVAAKSCPIEFVELLLRHGANVKAAHQGTDTPLVGAVRRGSLEICELLLKNGARITADADGWTPSHFAAMYGNIEMLKMFYELPVESHRPVEPYDKLLHLSRHIEVTQFLLRRGHRTDVLDTNGETPLIQLLERGSIQGPPGSFVEAVNLLLQHGANPSAKSPGGKSAVYWAIFSARSSGAVEALLAAGSNIFEPHEKRHNTTLLHNVAGLKPADSARIAKMLLDHGDGADISALDENGMSPLRVAVRSLHWDLIKLLMSRGADPMAVDRHGRTLLHELIDVIDDVSENKGLVRKCAGMLLDVGVDQNIRHCFGLTALHEAILLGRQNLVELFLRRGADVRAIHTYRIVNPKSAKDEASGQFSLLHAAVTRPNLNIVRSLLEHGAAVDAVDSKGRTPLHWATELQADAPIVELLLEAGADPEARDSTGRKSLEPAPEQKSGIASLRFIHMAVPCRYSY
jgi:ankyrin repeat protein